MTKNTTPSRIVASGISASAALVLVGAMAASARSAQVTPAPPPVIEQLVTIQIPALAAGTNEAMAIDATEVFDAQVTVVREVRTLPAPASNPVRAAAPTEGS